MKNDIFRTDAPQTVLVGSGGRTMAGSGDTSLIMKCPKAYQYQMRGITVPASRILPHFSVGLVFAAMRKRWFALGFKSDEATWQTLLREAQKEAERQSLPVGDKDIAFAQALFGEYINHWIKYPRPKVIAVEYKLGPCALVPGDPKELFRTARLDDLSKYTEAGGALCIGEAKTTSADFGSVKKEYELHVQPMLYTALYLNSKKGLTRFGPIGGVMLDVAKKPEGRSKAAFQRIYIEIRKKAVADFIESARYYVEMAKRIQWDTPVMRTYRCTEMHGRARVECVYKNLCRFGESGAGEYVMLDGTPLRKYKPESQGHKLKPWE